MDRDEALEAAKAVERGDAPSGDVVIAVTGPNSLHSTTPTPVPGQPATIQIVHSRDPDWECSIEVFIDGQRFTGTVAVEDIDPGRGWAKEDYEARRREAQDKATQPGATDFDRSVAENLAEARFEKFS